MEVGYATSPTIVNLFSSDSDNGSTSESESEPESDSQLSTTGVLMQEVGKDDGPEDKFDKGLSKSGTVRYGDRP